jgi:hypothetical protein
VSRRPPHSPRSPKRLSAFCLLLLTGGVAACADLVSPSQEVGVILPAAADLLVMIRSVDDVTSRVGPALGTGSAAGEVRGSLDALRSALNAADAPAADRALTRANTALTVFKNSPESANGAAPDASVVELALLFIEASMRRPCESFPGASLIDPASTSTTHAAYSCKQ